MALSKEEAHHHEAFLWENQKWVLSNSDNTSGGSHEKSGKKVLPSSNTLNGQTQLGKELAKSKRGRGDVHKNGKGSDDSGAKHEKASGVVLVAAAAVENRITRYYMDRKRKKKNEEYADKSTIVDEAVNYIKTLQQTLQKLQKQKLERLQDQGSNNLAIASTKPSNNVPSVARFPVLFQTWTSSNVVLNICGDEAQISICSSKKHCLFTTICYVLEKHNIEILSAHVSSDCNQSMYMIQAHACVEKVLKHFNMNKAKPVTVPFAAHFKLSTDMSLKTDEEMEHMSSVPYLSAVGSIIMLWAKMSYSVVGYVDLDFTGDFDRGIFDKLFVYSFWKCYCKLQLLCLP
ncbi:hypothetical protein GH714_034378 [Hevea brasiliensis]|uniref:BHLH domain-containing protein n=1 Tax=Hevea brasiliensis TaxID=3981 RepID=A0A6A6N985_HEVBR|nr:hypothetical protein GH714_034378 [Hevea brasiliensis]